MNGEMNDIDGCGVMAAIAESRRIPDCAICRDHGVRVPEFCEDWLELDTETLWLAYGPFLEPCECRDEPAEPDDGCICDGRCFGGGAHFNGPA